MRASYFKATVNTFMPTALLGDETLPCYQKTHDTTVYQSFIKPGVLSVGLKSGYTAKNGFL
jgi:hypothetical protein